MKFRRKQFKQLLFGTESLEKDATIESETDHVQDSVSDEKHTGSFFSLFFLLLEGLFNGVQRNLLEIP